MSYFLHFLAADSFASLTVCVTDRSTALTKVSKFRCNLFTGLFVFLLIPSLNCSQLKPASHFENHRFGSFVPNVSPQTPQNVTLVLSLNSLPLRDQFMVHNPTNVKKKKRKRKKDQYALGCAPDLMLLWRYSFTGSSTVKQCCLVSGS